MVWSGWPVGESSSTPRSLAAFSLVAFTLLAIASSFIYAWLRLKSGSLWTAVLLHASHNAFIQGFFDRVSRSDGAAQYLIGEFGIVTVASIVVVAWLFWRRRGELP
jgi:membrane protease YdiL (CAAX protease family)